MGNVVMYASVSVDGFIAAENDWARHRCSTGLSNGDVPLDEERRGEGVADPPTTTPGRTGTRSGRQSSAATSST